MLPDPGKRNSARALCEALASGAASKTLPLTALDLSDNEIRDNGVIAIGGLISHLKHGLKLLDLTACHASAKATAVLLAAMKKGGGVAAGSLEQLRLGRNEIGPKNTGMLADVIARAGHLYELDLNGSGCTVQRITSALLSGTGAETLKVLNLGGNRLSRPDLAGLLHVVCGSSQLTTLNVSRCGLEVEGLLNLLQSIQLNTQLTDVHIDASCNPIGTLGAYYLAAALPRLTRLGGLLLNACSGGPELADEAASFNVMLIDALLEESEPTSLLELGLGLNHAPQSITFVQGIEKLLKAPSASRLTTLNICGGGSFRLKSELPQLLLAVRKAAESGNGTKLTYLDVSAHHCGDALLEALPPLLSGPNAISTLLIHDNQLSTSGIEQLGQYMAGGESPCTTELLVITHDDARHALTSNKGPKDQVARRLQTAVTRVQQVIATNRARKRLHPRMRHPKRGNDLNARMLSWPNWHELLNKTDGQGQPPPG